MQRTKRSPLLTIISGAWILALIVQWMIPPTSPLYHVAWFASCLLFSVVIVVQGIIYRRQSPEWIEIRGVLHKRPYAKWSANVFIAFGVFLLCFLLFVEVNRLLR